MPAIMMGRPLPAEGLCWVNPAPDASVPMVPNSTTHKLTIGPALPFEAIIAERDELRREVEALRADAERYRWLRAECEKHGGLTIAKEGSWGLNPWSGDDPDRAIDTARASTDEGVGK